MKKNAQKKATKLWNREGPVLCVLCGRAVNDKNAIYLGNMIYRHKTHSKSNREA